MTSGTGNQLGMPRALVRRRWRRYGLLALLIAVVLGVGLVATQQPRLLPRLLGGGGFVPKSAREAPRPFRFERPRFWEDASDEFRRDGRSWTVLVLGPTADGSIMPTLIYVEIRPTAERHEEYPAPGGPFASLDDFVDRMLPRDRQAVIDTWKESFGTQARDILYDYVFRRGAEDAPAASLPARARALLFEDRGYYYMLGYKAPRTQFDRNAEVFEQMVATFRFLE